MKFLLSLFLVIFTLNLNAQIDHWETAVYAEDIWQYFPAMGEPANNWNTLAFSASNWPIGQGGIGYGDGDDNTIINPIISLYQRRVFEVFDKTKIERIVFHADYDDGFVAYLNGIEIARANIEGTPPIYSTEADALREAQVYSGGVPVAFLLDVQQTQNILQDGENILAIQTHNFEGQSSSDLTGLYWLSFGITDASNNYGETPDFFENPFLSTQLPIVKINTNGQEIPDEPNIEAFMEIIWNGPSDLTSSEDTPNEYAGNITIEKRGQSSLFFPKNGYAIETKDEEWEDADVAFLNFPEEEDWVLHGPFSDKSLLRNVLAMKLARDMGQYASRTRLVELLINEQYIGVYVLMEKIKRDANRVDIANLREEDIAGDELTGGYVIKIDKDDADWISQYDIAQNPGAKLEFQYVSPRRTQIQPEQEEYIQSYVDSFEIAMKNPSQGYGGKFYYEYIDLKTFAEQFIINEISKNVDAYRHSTYLHKDKDSNGGLLKAGPVWDFNLAFGNADYCDGESTSGFIYDLHCDAGNPFWWEVLFNEPMFTNQAKCRWEELRAGPFHLDSLMAFIDEKVALIGSAASRNFQRWPILDDYVWPNAVVTGSYEGEIDYLKSYLTDRIAWMDANILGSCGPTETEDLINDAEFSISPNPLASQLLNINLPSPLGKDIAIEIYTSLGQKVFSKKTVHWQEIISLDLSSLIGSGIYFIKITREDHSLGIQKLNITR